MEVIGHNRQGIIYTLGWMEGPGNCDWKYSMDSLPQPFDLIDWENRIQKVLGAVPLEYTCELKYDGASISITYENGQLKRAGGDGFQGDDVTNNIKTIKSIPYN
jgi:DNA ligase (NAD+)